MYNLSVMIDNGMDADLIRKIYTMTYTKTVTKLC